jgi:hypothetical protein
MGNKRFPAFSFAGLFVLLEAFRCKNQTKPMSFEVEGKLIKKYDTENKTGTFQAREFVIEVMSGNYPQFVKFQLVQDRCSLLDPFEEGEEIKVHFDLRGREWQGKYFTNLNAWRLEKASTPSASAPPPADTGDGSFPSAVDEPSSAADDDLPF